MKEKFIKYSKWILVIILILIFLTLAEDLMKGTINNFDNNIYQMVTPIISSNMSVIMKIITSFANPIPLFIFSLILILFINKKKNTVVIIFNTFNLFILTDVLKLIFGRDRPSNINIIDEYGYSFPSGHAIASLAFYGLIIWFISRSNLSLKKKYIFIFLLIVLILLIGFSRIYLGVHYASDVIAGFSISLAYLIIYTHFISKYLDRGE